MAEDLDLSIIGLKMMVLGVQMTIFGRFLLQSEVVALLGGAVVLGGLFIR